MAVAKRATLLLQNRSIRHQVLLERLKAGEVKDMRQFLVEMDRALRLRVGATEFQRGRIEAQLAAIASDLRAIRATANRTLLASMADVAEFEAGFEIRSLESITTGFTVAAPTQVYAAALAKPLSLRGPGGGKLIEPFVRDWSDSMVTNTIGTIRQGFFEGQTNAQILRAIRGTGAARNEDGLLARMSRGEEALVRTVVQHMASVAREEVWAANSDLVTHVEWVSVLDDRTTQICASLSGRRFPVDEGPRPPIHVNACLSGTLIRTARGDVPIELVEVGDYVKTHTGAWRRVYTVMARHHDGPARTLINSLGCRVRLTNEHPILTKNKGWIEAGSVEAGDVFFHDPQDLAGLLDAAAPLVPQRVLTDAHNIVTRLTQELVSYGIFSSTAGVSSAVNLNQSVADNEVGVIGKDSIVRSVLSTNGVKDAGKESLMRGAFQRQGYGHGIPHFFHCPTVMRWVVGCHSVGRRLRNLGMSFRSLVAPMIVPSRVFDVLLRIADRMRLAFNFDAVSFADGIQCACTKPDLFLNKPDTLPGSEMLALDKGLNKILIHDDDSYQWVAATCSSIEEYHYYGMVYNIAVSGDETYTADGFVVHNCRSATTPVIDSRFDFLSNNAKQSSVSGLVDADLTYYEWLKQQDAGFQDSAIGPVRGKLLREGGLSAERFAELNIGKNYTPLTLEQMREIEPLAFERAGL